MSNKMTMKKYEASALDRKNDAKGQAKLNKEAKKSGKKPSKYEGSKADLAQDKKVVSKLNKK